MYANVTSDLVLGFLFASATLAGLVVVFLATASNQIKVFLSEKKLTIGVVSVPMKYISTQYLLLEWAALIAFGILAAAFVFAALIILPAAAYPSNGNSGPHLLRTAPWLPRMGLAMVIYGMEVIFAALVAMVSNDHVSIMRIVFPTFNYRRKPTWKKIAKFLAICLGISILAFLLLYFHLDDTNQSPHGLWPILKLVLWVVTGPGVLAWLTVLGLYWISGYVQFARQQASETDVYAIVRSAVDKVLLYQEGEVWCFPTVHLSLGGSSDRTRRASIKNRVSALLPNASVQTEPDTAIYGRSTEGLAPPFDGVVNEAYLYHMANRGDAEGRFPDDAQVGPACKWFEVNQIPLQQANEVVISAIPILLNQGVGKWRKLTD